MASLGAVPELVTSFLAARDQRPRNRPAGVLASGLLKGKGTRRETEGERNRTVTAEGKEPEDVGRRENQRKADEGEEPEGRGRETGGKPEGETGGREMRPQTAR